MKGLSQNQIAHITASFTCFAGLILLTFIYYFFGELPKATFVIPFILYVVVFFCCKILIENFIYRKIKTLYNSILTVKKSEDKIDLRDPNLMEEVERDIEKYAMNQNVEIESLKKMETYRREFLGNVSHELKTPIFNIQGYLETLLDGGLEDEEINVKYLQKAADNVDRISKIVEDLVFISQSESGVLLINYSTFNIYNLILSVYDDLEEQAQKKNIKLNFEEKFYRPIMVVADEEKIYQVVYNLLINAIKYSKEETRIKTYFFEIDNKILVEINDNGPGIAEEHLPHLFERFYRVDKSRSRNDGGTGLGLAIVKHIVEAHGQTISVRSKLGKGTVFGFTLKKA